MRPGELQGFYFVVPSCFCPRIVEVSRLFYDCYCSSVQACFECGVVRLGDEPWMLV